MKKFLILFLALMLCTAAFAETVANSPALPVRILEHEAAAIPLTDALTAAQTAIGKIPEQSLIRAELTEMSDGSTAWVVTIFDTGSFVDAWCVMLDAANGQVVAQETAQGGFFSQAYAAWTAEKGAQALWSLEDKQRYDALYAMLPSYGLPQESDISAETALSKALAALGLATTDGYEVGYGYLMGGEGYNGVWEICFVQNGQIVYQINLDAVTGDIYYMQPDEAGNG